MRTVYCVVVLMVLALLAACTGPRVLIDPDNDFDPTVNQTFAWFSAPIQSNGRNEFYYHLDRSLRQAVSTALINRGYRPAAKAQADFVVQYRFLQTVLADQGGIISPRDEMRSVWDKSIDVNNTALHNHPVPAAISHGSLELTLDSVRSGREIWKASAVKVLKNSDGRAKSVERAVQSVVPKMLNGLPSRAVPNANDDVGWNVFHHRCGGLQSTLQLPVKRRQCPAVVFSLVLSC